VLGVAGPDVVYSREGSYAVAPLPGHQAIVSDGVATTWRLGPAGQVIRRVARGGEVAADPAGNVYVALASGGQLALHAFTPQLASRWSRVEPVAPFADVAAISADPAGVTGALATPFGVASIRRFPATGGAGTSLHSGGALAALAPDGFAIATAWEGGFAVLLYDLAGGLRWARSFDALATVEVLTLGLGGQVVVGGHFSGPITFGGPTLEPAYDGKVDVDSYVLGLSREGGKHVFTTRIPTTVLTGAAGNAGRLVIASETIPYLLKQKGVATLQTKNNQGEGLLHAAARSGDVSTITLLRKSGLDPKEKNNAGQSPAALTTSKPKLQALNK
jgi:hypothetical protein